MDDLGVYIEDLEQGSLRLAVAGGPGGVQEHWPQRSPPATTSPDRRVGHEV